ncbi:ladderlectin-like [Paramisgurnus dabryanus]|uniref:ladderlectin-like n=1 Tax=Paramisgurnus dabryanus TaxID=90735 RepID=UPI0031F3AEE1
MAIMRALVLLFLVFSVESAPAEEDCPFGWTPFGTKCYKFFSQSVNWVTAEKNCESVDSNLAPVRSTAEHNFILSLVPGSTRTWIGGHDGEIDGQWLWADGSQFDFTSWCPTEPNNNGGKPEDCMEINFTTNRCWNDESCLTRMSYICAKPL